MIAPRPGRHHATGSFLLSALLLAGCVMPARHDPAPTPPILAASPVPQPAPAELRLVGTPRQGGLLHGLAPAGTTGLTLDDAPVAFDTEGNFIIAFDRDAPPNATLVATLADGRTRSRQLAVAPGDWAIEHVNASITGSATSAEFQRVRAGEVARINAARARHAQSDGWRQRFIWPVKARISGVFGSQRIYRGTPGSYHSGLDLAGGGGTVYVAPADGVVILATEEPFTLEGKLLMIDHGMGLNSAFLHNSQILVKEGDVVRQGQPIGVIGATGRVTGPHLHWSMKWNAARIDPLPLLPREP